MHWYDKGSDLQKYEFKVNSVCKSCKTEDPRTRCQPLKSESCTSLGLSKLLEFYVFHRARLFDWISWSHHCICPALRKSIRSYKKRGHLVLYFRSNIYQNHPRLKVVCSTHNRAVLGPCTKKDYFRFLPQPYWQFSSHSQCILFSFPPFLLELILLKNKLRWLLYKKQVKGDMAMLSRPLKIMPMHFRIFGCCKQGCLRR